MEINLALLLRISIQKSFMHCFHIHHLPFYLLYGCRMVIHCHPGNLAVLDLDHTVCHRCQRRVMGNDDHCHSTLSAHILQKVSGLPYLSGSPVHLWAHHTTTAWDSSPVPWQWKLSAVHRRKLCREIGQSVLQSHFLQNLPGIQRIFTNLQCQFYILQRCKIGTRL